METLTTAAKAAEQLVGEWREPRNRWQGAENSIHTDAVAKSIGMRGGTIPGVVHLGHFRPILTELFGERWLTRGAISMYYTYATLDGEKVRAVVEPPAEGATDNVQMAAWVEDAEGKTVCKGTVSVGDPDATPYVRGLPLESAPPGANRILRAMAPGMAVPTREDFRIADGADADGVVREPHYMFRALNVFPDGVDTKPAVGFYGATEIRLVNGPIRADTPYRRTGRVVAVCDSPKTEFAWFDSELTDADGRLVAEMRHMTRWMKVSSPLWKD